MTSEDRAGEPRTEEPVTRIEELIVEVGLLSEDNERLRAEYARARQSKYRRAAIGLGIIGIASLLASALFPPERTVLITLGAIGIFAGILTAYLTPERFVAASVGERTYTQLSRTLSEMIALLGLSDHRVYVPLDDDPDGSVRLFVPQADQYDRPDPDALGSPLVIEARTRGLSIRPTGVALIEELDASSSRTATADPMNAAEWCAEALVETFELADDVRPEVVLSDGRATFAVTGSVYGPVDRLDHPISSTLACGLAASLGQPVRVTVTDGDERSDALVTCEWETSEA